ncbi:hypothetical protein PanWU01x14_212030 [Parasponia andersonii]|uniref:Uncharacterized protein n=1 Tax=Parasponia andersonii TaxID=3476 RepID=A0A2P5BT76_PARAD|nr:hypothetical protein PanWU01x14_212030 [Parasponia andersonii]
MTTANLDRYLTENFTGDAQLATVHGGPAPPHTHGTYLRKKKIPEKVGPPNLYRKQRQLWLGFVGIRAQ